MSEDDRGREQTGAKRYQLRQKLIAIGNDYWIENEQGETVYKIDGKALRWRKTFILEDAHGNRLAKIQKPVMTVKETMEVAGPDGEQLALVKKDLLTPLKEHFVVKLKNGPDLEVHGNILDHEYSMDAGSAKVAAVSKQWLHVRDSYSVSIEPGQEDFIILAVVLCIDEMTHARG